MKILYMNQHFRFPEEPGIGRSWEFARRLAADGHEVTVLAGNAMPMDVVRDGFRAVRLSTPYDQAMSNLRRMIAFAQFMAASTLFASRSRYDVVFASSGPLTIAIPGLIAAMRSRARFVFEVRDVWPKVPIELGELTNPVAIWAAKRLERMAYAKADHIVALSPGMARDVALVGTEAKISVIPNASDITDFRELTCSKSEARREMGWHEAGPYLVFVGSLGRSYDIPWLVRLSAALRPHGVNVKIVGEGSTLFSSRALAESLGLDPHNLLPGPVAKSSVPKVLRAADAAISALADNPALEVNSLNKVFDAFAAQRPVFLNHGGWLAEIASANGAGWRLGRDVDRAAIQVLETLKSEDLRAAGAAAGRVAEAQFSRETLYREFREAVTGARCSLRV